MSFIKKKVINIFVLFFLFIILPVLLISRKQVNGSKLIIENEKGEQVDLSVKNKPIWLIKINDDNITYLPELRNIGKIMLNSGITTFFIYDRSVDTNFYEDKLEDKYYLSDESIGLEKSYSVYYNGGVISSVDDSVDSIDYVLDKLRDNNIEHELLSFLVTLDYGEVINPKSDKMLYLFSLTGCEMCKDVEKVLNKRKALTENFHSIVVICDYESDYNFFDPFNYISGFFGINQFPTFMEVDRTTLEYQIDNQELVSKVLEEMKH